jgi:hypothetical protein
MQGTYDVLVPYESTTIEERILKDKFKLRMDYRQDILNKILRPDMALEHPYIQVPHKVAPFLRVQLSTAIGTSTNVDVDVVLKKSAIYPVNIKVGTHLRNRSESFVVLNEPTVGTSTITCRCSRGTSTIFGSTAVATHAVNDWFEILPEVLSDVTEFDRSDHIIGEKQVAYTQFIKGFEIEMADNAEPLDALSASGDYSMQKQLDDGMNLTRQKFLKVAFRGIHAAGTPSNATTNIANKRQARGFVSALTDYNGIVNSASGLDLSTDMIDSDIQEYIDRGGLATFPNSSLSMLVSSQKKAINKFLGSRLRASQDETTVKNFVTRYEGEVPVDIYMVGQEIVPSTEYLMLNLEDQLHVAFLQGRGLQIQDLAKTGSSKKKWIVADIGVVTVNPELGIRRHTLKDV